MSELNHASYPFRDGEPHQFKSPDMRVQIDGRLMGVEVKNGNVLVVDSRQYVVLKPGGSLTLESPDRHRPLGYIEDYRDTPFSDEYFSEEKNALIQAGIESLLDQIDQLG